MPTPRERIREWSRKIQRALDTKLPQTESEAVLRRLVAPLLEQFCHELGLNPSVRSEYTLATGRADAVFNRFVIEYERPGSLKAVSDRATQLSIGQVKRYIEELAQKERHQVERLAGVAFDGHQLAFVRWVNRQWAEVELVPVTLDSVERMLTWLTGLASGTALTPEISVATSPSSRGARNRFYNGSSKRCKPPSNNTMHWSASCSSSGGSSSTKPSTTLRPSAAGRWSP